MEENLIQINNGIMINVNLTLKKRQLCENDYAWNLATCNCENGKYLACFMNNSAIICDEVIDANA